MESVEKFITVVGALEDVIFQKRMRLLQRDKNRRARDRQAIWTYFPHLAARLAVPLKYNCLHCKLRTCNLNQREEERKFAQHEAFAMYCIRRESAVPD